MLEVNRDRNGNVIYPLMIGDDVYWVQRQLIVLKIGSGLADGKYGEHTEAWVKVFQKAAWPKTPAEWDGKVGPKTLAKLLKS